MAMTDDDIIRARLLVDDRPVKRLIKKLYALANCPVEDLDVAYSQLILELDAQDAVGQAKGKASGIARTEIQTYEAEISRIEEETREAERTILELKEQLAHAQQTRKNKIVYDNIAKEALKLPSRAHSSENIARLTAELKELEAEKEHYATTWAGRQQAFDSVVRSLEELGERVREEKSEQERRDALGDDDVQEDAAATQPPTEPQSAEESGTEDMTASDKRKSLDPTAKAFEPSPLRLATSEAGNGTNAGGMEVDEDGEVQSTVEESADRVTSRASSRNRSVKEEGEEEDEAMQTAQ